MQKTCILYGNRIQDAWTFRAGKMAWKVPTIWCQVHNFQSQGKTIGLALPPSQWNSPLSFRRFQLQIIRANWVKVCWLAHHWPYIRHCPIFPTNFKILTTYGFRWVGGPELMHLLELCRYKKNFGNSTRAGINSNQVYNRPAL